jgi:ubiquinone/menaquinone biosynthesis C-methylase UbiE
MPTHASATKPYKGMGMEGVVAKWYANITRKSLEDFKTLARRTAEQLPAGSRVLEVAPGPGYFAIELAKLDQYEITGLDISQTFVDIARANATQAHVTVDFRRGNASGMPFEDQTFDYIVCRAAFKNFSDPVGALEEMHRVLKPGGRAMIIDLRKDASWNSIKEAAKEMHLGPVNGMITKLTFRFMLLPRAYTKRDFEQLVSQAHFRKVQIQESPIGLEILLRKSAGKIAELAEVQS